MRKEAGSRRTQDLASVLFGHDIIVIGASVGGVEALTKLIRSLPKHLPASVFIVLHIAAYPGSRLPQVISRGASLSAEFGVDGETIRHGRVYVAPPDHHLRVDGTRVRLSRGPRVNFLRPSIDTLFRTAAHSYGPRVSGVVLTGNLDDGSAGLQAVKSRGGIAIVQDPAEAEAPSMPQSALLKVQVDYCVPLAEMGAILARLAFKRDIPTILDRSSTRQNSCLKPGCRHK